MRQINMKCIKLKLYLAPQRTVQFYWVRRMFQSVCWGLRWDVGYQGAWRPGLECHDEFLGEDWAGQLNLYQYFTLIRGTRPRYQLRLCLLCGWISLLAVTVMGRGFIWTVGVGASIAGHSSRNDSLTWAARPWATTPDDPIESVDYGWEVIVWINLLNWVYLYQQRQYSYYWESPGTPDTRNISTLGDSTVRPAWDCLKTRLPVREITMEAKGFCRGLASCQLCQRLLAYHDLWSRPRWW